MGITNYGYNFFVTRLGSNISAATHIGIGSGSGVFNAATSGLYNEVSRQAFSTGYPDYSETYVIKWLADWNTVQLSGLSIREAALFQASTGSVAIQKSHFPAITFTGSEELQVEIDVKVL